MGPFRGARCVPGGIGATINIKTARPLESAPLLNLGVKTVHDTSNGNLPDSLQGSDFTGELSGIFSQTYADGRFGLLIILQGMDASGKDGICRHVMSAMNPMGVQVTSFKKPTAAELEHDFLYRIYPHFPPRGMIKVFNRSYYEDILVPTVEGTLPPELIAQRYELINTIEKHLNTVLKSGSGFGGCNAAIVLEKLR